MPPKQPSDDDLTLWQLAMRDVKRMFGALDEDVKPTVPKPKPPLAAPQKKPDLLPFAPSFGLKLPAPDVPAEPSNPGIDRRTEDRFRKGQMPIEARLDLHGLTLREAEPAVREFVRLNHAANRRCLLIITGKGQGSSTDTDRAWYESAKGQIKRSLKHWLDAPDVQHLVLSVAPAQRQHGGSGAFYILLRRKR